MFNINMIVVEERINWLRTEPTIRHLWAPQYKTSVSKQAAVTCGADPSLILRKLDWMGFLSLFV